MNSGEGQVSDVVVILHPSHEGRTDDAVRQLADAGLTSAQLVSNEGAVEGTIEASKVAGLKRLACVSDVRTVFTYMAERDGLQGAGQAEPDPDLESDSV